MKQSLICRTMVYALGAVLFLGALRPVGAQAEPAAGGNLAQPAPAPAGPDLPSPALFLDANWYRSHLIHSADLWNGGRDGQAGLGSYRSDFAGLFHIDLDRQWGQLPMDYSTAVAQSRAIYMNVEAYRAAGPAEGARFLQAVRQGAGYLLAHFRDAQYGGFYWAVRPDGSVADTQKWGYGNTFPLFALSQAYSVTADPAQLQAARDQLAVIRAHLLDPSVPCGIRWSTNRDFTGPSGDNNLGNWIHLFEALLSYYDVASSAEKAAVGQLIQTCGDFAVGSLYRDQAGYTDRGYLAGSYDAAWRPAGTQAEPAHMLELAFLLSRAVERGLPNDGPAWLATAHKMVTFATAWALDPAYHAMRYYVIGFDGRPLPGNPENAYWTWWPQTETARALLHFAVVRGWDTAAAFKAEEDFIHRYQTDQEYRGLWERVTPGARGVPQPDPSRPNKGHIWKTNYHYSSFFAEALRLSALYPDRLAALNPPPPSPPPAKGHTAYLPLLLHE